MTTTRLIVLTTSCLLFTACDFDINITGTVDETGQLLEDVETEPGDQEEETGEFDEEYDQEEEEDWSEEDEHEGEEEEYEGEEDEEEGPEDDEDDSECEDLLEQFEEEIDFLLEECNNGDVQACEDVDAIFEFLDEHCDAETGTGEEDAEEGCEEV